MPSPKGYAEIRRPPPGYDVSGARGAEGTKWWEVEQVAKPDFDMNEQRKHFQELKKKLEAETRREEAVVDEIMHADEPPVDMSPSSKAGEDYRYGDVWLCCFCFCCNRS